MEILIILGYAILVFFGVFLQKSLNKIKEGNSALAKEIPKSFKVAMLMVLVIVGGVLVTIVAVKDKALTISLMPVMAGFIAMIIIAIFSKSGLSLIGINGGVFSKEKASGDNKKNNKAYFKKRNIVLIIIAVIMTILFIVDYI